MSALDEPRSEQDNFARDVLDYHRYPAPGKISVTPTKDLLDASDLSLAYTPGIGIVCQEIHKDETRSFSYTARGNLIGVITNGTAVLGLGDIGPAAAKPVMEGKSVLFKKFAGIDVFDIELNQSDPDLLIEIIASMEPTFGGINLEDIKAPDCFVIEEALRKRLNIPVFHDDQHGTAIVVCAAILNALFLIGKEIEDVKLVASGAGAAALACLNMLIELGMVRENIWVTDLAGVVYDGRINLMDPYKAKFAQPTNMRGLDEVIADADIFLGLSASGVLKQSMVAKMATQPIVLALANPIPEIMPELVKAVRPDAIVATGRSDYPNQVNNLLCFPYIFRGALDSGAIAITPQMQTAAVYALAELARREQCDIVSTAYGDRSFRFGPNYLIPKPFDPRLITAIAPAVAAAAMASGVATRPVDDWQTYRSQLQSIVYRSGMLMAPIIRAARAVNPRENRLVYSDGEDHKVLRAVQDVVDEGIARPILIGRFDQITQAIKDLDLRLKYECDYTIIDPEKDGRFADDLRAYQIHDETGDRASPERLRPCGTLVGAMLISRREADSMLCGPNGGRAIHLQHIDRVLGKSMQTTYGEMQGVILGDQQLFLVDAYSTSDPNEEQISELAIEAAKALKNLGIYPRITLLSPENVDTKGTTLSLKMKVVQSILKVRAPDLSVHIDYGTCCAFDSKKKRIDTSTMKLFGEANLLIFPNSEAAKLAHGMLRSFAGKGVGIGPILLGSNKAVHILSPSTTVRGILNMTALAVMESVAKKNT